MSPSDPKPARGKGELVAFGDPGVEIQIVDTNYQVQARGTDKVQKTLPEGVYMVDWTSNGQTVQKLVRLLPIGKPLEVRPDAPLAGVRPSSRRGRRTLRACRSPNSCKINRGRPSATTARRCWS